MRILIIAGLIGACIFVGCQESPKLPEKVDARIVDTGSLELNFQIFVYFTDPKAFHIGEGAPLREMNVQLVHQHLREQLSLLVESMGSDDQPGHLDYDWKIEKIKIRKGTHSYSIIDYHEYTGRGSSKQTTSYNVPIGYFADVKYKLNINNSSDIGQYKIRIALKGPHEDEYPCHYDLRSLTREYTVQYSRQ